MRYRRCSSCDTSNEHLNVDGNQVLCDWCLIAKQDARQAMHEEAIKNQVPQEVRL